MWNFSHSLHQRSHFYRSIFFLAFLVAGAYAICSDEEMECPGQMNPDGKFANFDNITSKTKHIKYMTINVTILGGGK